MADQKITDLTAYTTPIATDMLPIADVTTGTTKKISYVNLFKVPFANLSSSQSQTIASTTAEYAITFNTNDLISGITHSTTVNPSRIQIDQAGSYLITFSAIGKSAVANKSLDIWLKVDGVNVANSNTVSRFVGSANERIITVTYIYTFTASQYFELYMASNDTGTHLLATGTQTNPTRPACPSIIITVNKVSN